MRTKRPAATLIATTMTLIAYVAIAWLASTIEIPPDVPTASVPWFAPFRLVSTLGYVLARLASMPHLAGDFLAAILLGALLGGVFAFTRVALS